MKHNVESRKDIRTVLNKNICSIFTPQDFTNPVLAGNYLSQLVEKNIVERVGRGKYKILKKSGTQKRNPPTKPTREKKFNISTRAEIRKVLNENIGTIITTQDFTKPAFAANYLYQLTETGNVENIGFGKYQILKKVSLKKKGPKKGVRQPYHSERLKDLSNIPEILNSSEQGLVLRQIESKYEQITHPSKQVNRNYLYRLCSFGIKEGILIHNGVNKDMRELGKGPFPKRIILKDKNISQENWDVFVEKFRSHYQYKKNNKSTRVVKTKSLSKLPSKINNSFDENRDNKNKVIVERFFFETVKQYLNNEKVRCLAITGPDYNRHVQGLFSTIADEVFIVEIDNEVFRTIFNKAQICPNYLSNKVKLINTDINDVIINNCRYIDLDLMSSTASIFPIVHEQVKLQKYFVNFNELKFLTFTACNRKDGGPNDRLIALERLLHFSFQAKLKGFQGKSDDCFGEPIVFNKEGNNEDKNLKHCYKRIPIFSDYGCIVDIHVFTYQDTSPMISVLAVYK